MNQKDYCKIADSNYHYHNYYDYYYLYTFFSMYGCACGCVRPYEYHSTLPHLLPSMNDFMIY